MLAVVAVLVAVALCAAALRASEAGLEFEKVTGRPGQTIEVSGGWVRVSDVRVADTLLKNNVVTSRTAGMFVVLRVAVAATGPERISYGDARLRTRVRTYLPWSDDTAAADTGLVVARDLVVEVDPAGIDDLTLELSPAGFVTGYDEHVVVFLGVTAANAHQWRDAARDQTVEPLGQDRVEGVP